MHNFAVLLIKETLKRNNESVWIDKLCSENSNVVNFAIIGLLIEEKLSSKFHF